MLKKKLKKGITLKIEKGEDHWASFKYKRILTFCYLCGLLGHGDKFYSKRLEISEEVLVREWGARYLCSSTSDVAIASGGKIVEIGTVLSEVSNDGRGNHNQCRD